MKNKPVKHKTTNTFRFVPFAERINSINIRHAALYHIEHQYTKLPEENETHFYLAVQKWHGLNLTSNFKKFKREVHGVVTVPQLLHKKDEIIDILERYLNLEDELCLQPLLEIVVSLAKDLRDDFYPHFPRFLDILIKLLDTKDAERLEWTLVCLAFLFKVLKPLLKKDIAVILKRIIPLLSESHPQYINNFAAESFAFVARDIRDKKKFITLILDYLQTNEDAIVGCGHLVFEILRGVGDKFHSCAETFLPLLLQHLTDVERHRDALFRVLTQTIEDGLGTVAPEHHSTLWAALLEATDDALRKEEADVRGLEYLLRLGGQLIEHQHGRYVTDARRVALTLARAAAARRDAGAVCARAAAALLRARAAALPQDAAGPLARALLLAPRPAVLLEFVRAVADCAHFEAHVLPPFVDFVARSGFEAAATSALADVCATKSPPSGNGVRLLDWVRYPLALGRHAAAFADRLVAAAESDAASEPDAAAAVLHLAICLPHVENADVDRCGAALARLAGRLLDDLAAGDLESAEEDRGGSPAWARARRALVVLGAALEAIAHSAGCAAAARAVPASRALGVLLPLAARGCAPGALHALDLYVTAARQAGPPSFAHLCLVDSYLRRSVSSPWRAVRLLATHVYAQFEGAPELPPGFATFGACFRVEATPPSLAEYRAQLSALRRLAAAPAPPEFATFALEYMLGLLHVNFRLLWEPVCELVASLGATLPPAAFWPPFAAALRAAFGREPAPPPPLALAGDLGRADETVRRLSAALCGVPERPDRHNYRDLLLGVMAARAPLCEARNRDVAELFLKFVEDEFRREDGGLPTVDVRVRGAPARADDDRPASDVGEADDDERKADDDEREADDDERKADDDEREADDDEREADDDEREADDDEREADDDEREADDDERKVDDDERKADDDERKADDDEREADDDEREADDDEREADDDEREADDGRAVRTAAGKRTFKTMIRIMEVLAKFKNPRALYEEPRFRDLYMELLKNKNPALQRCALECILNYRHPSVVPYRSHLLNLADEKKFKGEMTRFQLTEGAGGVHADDRPHVVPLALRLLLGKMAGGRRGAARRALVLRYLAGWPEDERRAFVRMAFARFERFAELPPRALRERLLSSLELAAVPAPAALLAALDLFDVALDHLGGRASDLLLSELVRVFLGVCSTAAAVAARADDVLVGYRKRFRGVRAVATNALAKLFERFERYRWTRDELVVAFETLVRPAIAKLHLSAANERTPALRLLDAWCSNPRYHALLATAPDGADTALAALARLLAAPAAAPAVVGRALDMLEKLLTLAEEEDAPPMEAFGPLERRAARDANLNFGSELLVPHAPAALAVIRRRLANASRSSAANGRDLLILARLAELATAPGLCDELLALLLPILVRRACANASEENAERAVTAIANLIGRSARPEANVRELGALFDRVGALRVRTLLLELVAAIAARAPPERADLSRTARLLAELNAFERRALERPDFERRLAAHEELYALADAGAIDVDLGVLVANDRFRAIRTERDVALRDAAALCLRRILPGLLARHAATAGGRFLARDTVLALISSGIRDSRHEVLRAESVALLGVLARACPAADPVLADLAPLADERDPEVDFFENACHLQTHRRVRALLRFCRLARKRPERPTARTLTNFILPLASSYLYDDAHADKNSLIDACIETVVTCCRLLPWYHYERVLRLHLGRMRTCADHRKQAVRIVAGILDAFHFDFSRVKDVELPRALLVGHADAGGGPLGPGGGAEAPPRADDAEEELAPPDDGAGEEAQAEPADTPAFERTTVVSPSVGRRIVRSLAADLLPQLYRAVGKLSEHEAAHRAARRGLALERLEQELQRAPLALALVKLLQRLPAPLLDRHLPGILGKLCSFLKSPLRRVRAAVRDTVRRVMEAAGGGALAALVDALGGLRARGFAAHALAATLHAALVALERTLTPAQAAAALPYALDVCVDDLFGALAAEKEVAALARKTPEARSAKRSLATLALLARTVPAARLAAIVAPLARVLREARSRKLVARAREALAHVGVGLVANGDLSTAELVAFLRDTVAGAIPGLGGDASADEARPPPAARARPDVFLVAAAPGREREARARRVRAARGAEAPALLEFALGALVAALKRERAGRGEWRALLGPLAPALLGALRGECARAQAAALRACASLWSRRAAPSELEAAAAEVLAAAAGLLRRFAAGALAAPDNAQAVRLAFRAVCALLRHAPGARPEGEALHALLLCAERELDAEGRRGGSFALLRAMLDAGAAGADLLRLVEKVSALAVLDASDGVRREARALVVQWAVGAGASGAGRWARAALAQLLHPLAHVRCAALRLLHDLLLRLPTAALEEVAGEAFVGLGAAMRADEASEAREAAAAALEDMLRRLPPPAAERLHGLALAFLDRREPEHCELGAQLAARFVAAEGERAARRAGALLPRLAERLREMGGGARPLVRAPTPDDGGRDHALVQLLNLLRALAEAGGAPEAPEAAAAGLAACGALLAHAHAWVRRGAAGAIAALLGARVSPAPAALRALVLDLCAQCTPAVPADTAREVAEALHRLLLLLLEADGAGAAAADGVRDDGDDRGAVTVRWVLRRTRRAVNAEVSRAPTRHAIREAVFSMWARLVSALEGARVAAFADVLVPALARELDAGAGPARERARAVAKKLRRKIGDLAYGRLLAAATAALAARRAARSELVAREKVAEPARAAKRKLRLKERKRAAKRARPAAGGRPRKRKADPLDIEDALLDD